MLRALALLAALTLSTSPALAAEKGAGGAKAVKAAARVEIKVTDDGFVPKDVKLKRGQPTALVFTRVTENTCITAIDIPDEKVKELELPLNQPVTITVTPKKKGVEKFHCSAMGMGDGKLVVE